MIIRQERPEDYGEVFDMVRSSFATTDYSDGTEAEYLTALRSKSCFIPELSLVAIEDARIVGQIVLYRMRIDCADRTEEQLVLSPLSVRPGCFGRGIGAKLIEQGCRLASKRGYCAVFLCGSYDYYSRFGFVPTYKYGIFHRKDKAGNADWCMVKELVTGYLSAAEGTVDIE